MYYRYWISTKHLYAILQRFKIQMVHNVTADWGTVDLTREQAQEINKEFLGAVCPYSN